MVPYIQLFSLALILMTVQILFAPVTNALGKPSISMFPAMSGAILFPASFLIGAQWGLVGIAWAWLVSAPLLLIVTARLSETGRASCRTVCVCPCGSGWSA